MAETDMVQSIIRDSLQVAILKALSNEQDLIPKMIACVVEEKVKVDAEGNRVNSDRHFYGTTKEVSYIDYLCKEAIREAARGAVQAWVRDRIPEIQQEISSKLQSSDFSEPLVRAVMSSLQQNLDYNFLFKCNVEVKKRDEN